MSQAPICVKCAAAYRVVKNEVWLSTPGALRCGDLWRCPVCEHRLLTGFGQPIYEGQPAYAGLLAKERTHGELVVVA